MRIHKHPHQYYSRHSRMIRQIRIGLSRHSHPNSRNSHRVKGVSLVEVVLGTALILLSLVGLTGAYSFYLKAGLKNTDTLKAAFLLQEAVEAVTLLRDDGWNNFSSLTSGAPYYLFWNGVKWTATTTAAFIDGAFRRTVTFDEVYRRNSDKDIVASTSPDAKTFDPNAKGVTVRVTAPGIAVSVVTYLTNLFE